MSRLRLCASICVVLSACTQPPATHAPTHNTSAPAHPAADRSNFSRVVVVVMENKEYSSVIGNPEAPYTNGLAKRWALATNFFAITHPSLPNYLALTGGSTFGITSNCTTCHVAEPSIADQLEDAGISWKAYLEGMPTPCYRGPNVGLYSKKHNPFAYYDGITSDARRCAKVVPMDELTTDVRADRLPRFVWITPDNCNNTHNCSVRRGDDFLSNLLPPLLRSLGSDGVLILTYDEGSTKRGCCRVAAGGHIVTIVAGPGAKPGRVSETYTLYSILRTIEDGWGLPHLGNAATAHAMTAMLR